MCTIYCSSNNGGLNYFEETVHATLCPIATYIHTHTVGGLQDYIARDSVTNIIYVSCTIKKKAGLGQYNTREVHKSIVMFL